MKFKELKNYLTKQMRMSHVYQPVMIRNLIKNKGKASSEKIAKDLLVFDVSQVEYYQERTKIMVGKVLTKNKVTTKEGDAYSLNDFESLSADEQKELIKGSIAAAEHVAIMLSKYETAEAQHYLNDASDILGQVRISKIHELSSGIILIVSCFIKNPYGNILTRLAGFTIAVLMINIFVVAHTDWLVNKQLFINPQIFLLVGGVYFLIKGNRK